MYIQNNLTTFDLDENTDEVSALTSADKLIRRMIYRDFR